MTKTWKNRKIYLTLALLLAFLSHGSTSSAQSNKPVDTQQTVKLAGSVHPLAQKQYDQGAMDDSLPMNNVIVLFKRPAEKEAALEKFLSEAHTQGSASYHKWLTPEQFGAQYGPSDADVQRAQAWLQSKGLRVNDIAKGKSTMSFSGGAGQVGRALGTSMRTYQVNGETHHANATAPQIPKDLESVIAGIVGLDDFHPKRHSAASRAATFNPKNHAVTPMFSDLYNRPPTLALAPEDLAMQYNIKPLHDAGTNGTGVKIGIIDSGDIDIDVVNAYRKFFGLPANPPRIITTGSLAGSCCDGETYLDAEVAAAAAPNATIDLYMSTALNDPWSSVNQSVIRAVNDNVDDILSASYGACEVGAGNAGNLFNNAEWEQAAAQGQTVLVSTGDSGSAQCEGFNAEPGAAQYGLGVSDLASTPWNISVGGTDFYYSDYAQGEAAIEWQKYWNQNNDDGTYGSLKKPVSEQAWSESLYGLNLVATKPGIATGGGGGGASSCVEQHKDADGNTVCDRGYLKPPWQVGTGVPADGVRDLPDVSLYAAYSRDNYSAYAVCMDITECDPSHPDPSTNLPVIGLSGGTSASTPVFAGIMALVVQKHGRQGQANNVLYPLAAQYPEVFHDVTVGSNNVPCNPMSDYPQNIKDCTLDLNWEAELAASDPKLKLTKDSFYSLQHYAATAGYDMATGLGSVDAYKLVTNWKSITFQTTLTNLSLSPTSIKHGEKVTATATVTGSGGTPKGYVAVVIDANLPAQHGQRTIELTNGTGSRDFTSLPGGTYQVHGRYGGDGIYSPSESQPVSLTVTSEDSKVQITFAYTVVDKYNNANATSFPNGGVLPFGRNAILVAKVRGINASFESSDGTAATGTITFKDGPTTLATVPVNSQGTATYSMDIRSLNAGSAHNITAGYIGDASYKKSDAEPASFTVGENTAGDGIFLKNTLGGAPDPSDPNPLHYPTKQIFRAGGNVVFALQISAGGDALDPTGQAPSGTMTLTLGSQTQTVPVTQAYIDIPAYKVPAASYGMAIASFTNLPEGIFDLQASYSGDALRPAAAEAFPKAVTVIPAGGILPTTTLLTVAPTVDGLGKRSLTLTATVNAPAGMKSPTGMVHFDRGLTSVAHRGPIPLGTNGTATTTITGNLALSGIGDNHIVAWYEGDSTYQSSASIPFAISGTAGEFSIVAQNPNITVASGIPGTAVLNLDVVNGFNQKVDFTCSVSGPTLGNQQLPGCSLNPASATISGPTTVTLTVSAGVATARQERWTGGWWMTGGSATLACLFLLNLPAYRRQRWQMLFCFFVFASLAVVSGCSGGLHATPSAADLSKTLTPGSYSVVVTGTAANGIIHNSKITVVIK